MNESFRTYLVGRFQIDVPARFTRSHQESQVAGIEVEEIVFGSAPSPGVVFRNEWTARLAKIRTMKTDASTTRIVEEKERRPGIRVVEYKEETPRNDTPMNRTFEALIDGGTRGLVVKHTWLEGAPGDPDDPETAARKKQMVSNFTEVIDAQRFIDTSGRSAPDANWFYLPNAAVAVPFQRSLGGQSGDDFVKATFRDPSRGADLTLTATFPWPKSSGDEGLIGGFAEAIGRQLTDARVTRKGKRSVAGFKGDEVIVRDNRREQAVFSWVWKPKPDSGEGFQPDLDLEMRADAAYESMAIALWDHILDSIVCLPRK